MNDTSDHSGDNSSLPGHQTDKAVAELIRSVGKPLTESLMAAVGDIYGGLVGDRLREWRTLRAVEFAEKTVRALNEKGIDTSALASLPNGRMYEICSASVNEGDEEIQEYWSRLLASYAAGEINADYERTFSQILKQLRPVDAHLLAMAFEVEGFHQRWNSERTRVVFNLEKDTAEDADKSEYYLKMGLFSKERETFSAEIKAKVSEVPADLLDHSINQLEGFGLIEVSKERIHPPTPFQLEIRLSDPQTGRSLTLIEGRAGIRYLERIIAVINGDRYKRARAKELYSSDDTIPPLLQPTALGSKFRSVCMASAS